MGVAAVWFGMTVPLIVSSVGMSVDLAQSYLVRERLSHALDAAALAAASMATDDPDEIEQKVNDFIEANYPPDKVGFTTVVNVTSTYDKVNVEATAELSTTFMKAFGMDTVEVSVESEVTKEVKAIEVVLVMDVTGSMSINNNIATLRTAATDFVDTMFDRVKDKNDLKIGLVPFSTSVNVGPYGLGKTPGGLAYDTPFMENPLGLEYSSTNTNKWMGCILEDENPKDEQDHPGPWKMYRYCRDESDKAIPGCDTLYNSALKIYKPMQTANYVCPMTPVTPLTNSESELKDSIATLKANGNTYINIGLVWGERLISPEYPFTEGESWSNEDWKKAVILMTDGVNMPHVYYSAYGPTATSGVSAATLDARMLNVCQNLKDKDVLVYTVTFDAGVDSYTKNLFKTCATQESMWYHAPTQAKLIEVYQTIAKELADMHVSK